MSVRFWGCKDTTFGEIRCPVRDFSPASRMSDRFCDSRPDFLPGCADESAALYILSVISPRLSGREYGFIFPVRDFSPAARTSDRFCDSRPGFLPSFPDESTSLYISSGFSPRLHGWAPAFETFVRDGIRISGWEGDFQARPEIRTFVRMWRRILVGFLV